MILMHYDTEIFLILCLSFCVKVYSCILVQTVSALIVTSDDLDVPTNEYT